MRFSLETNLFCIQRLQLGSLKSIFIFFFFKCKLVMFFLFLIDLCIGIAIILSISFIFFFISSLKRFCFTLMFFFNLFASHAVTRLAMQYFCNLILHSKRSKRSKRSKHFVFLTIAGGGATIEVST